MLIRKPNLLDGSAIAASEITPREQFEANKGLSRRSLLRAAATAGVGAMALDRLAALALPGTSVAAAMAADASGNPGGKLATVPGKLTTSGEKLTTLQDVTHYNNFYEFGVDKSAPAENAGGLPTRPWTIKVSGLVKKPLTFDIDALLKMQPLEDRVYRHRCVEAWSMVIPWVGYSFSQIVNACEPLSTAKYVQFLSYFDPKVEKWWPESSIHWPYSEGLRMDEAMNPLTLFTFGLYGEVLPNQNGAPVRVVLPWKYGYKSAKSIVGIRFLASQPPTTWNDLAPDEYGFYSNVNPNVDHPRWTQKYERRIGEAFYAQKRATLMYNGYGDFVAGMYAGMDLTKNH